MSSSISELILDQEAVAGLGGHPSDAIWASARMSLQQGRATKSFPVMQAPLRENLMQGAFLGSALRFAIRSLREPDPSSAKEAGLILWRLLLITPVKS